MVKKNICQCGGFKNINLSVIIVVLARLINYSLPCDNYDYSNGFSLIYINNINIHL